MASTYRLLGVREETRDDGKVAFDRVPLLTDGTLNIDDENHIISANSVKLLVWNATGSTLTAETIVYPSGWNNTESLVQVTSAQANNDLTMPAIGIIESDILNGESGIIIQTGIYDGIDTSGQSVGNRVYLSNTSVGELSFTKTSQEIGKILTSANPGVVYFNFLKGQQVFGADYTSVSSTARSVTTSQTFQTKTSITIPAVNGKFKINWAATGDTPGKKDGEYRLFNTTDSTAIQTYTLESTDSVFPIGGFGFVTMAGVSKIFEIQFRATGAGNNDVAISEAYLDIWRVS